MTLDEILTFFDGLACGTVTLGKSRLSDPKWYCFVSARHPTEDYLLYIEGRGSTAVKAARRCHKAYTKASKIPDR